MIATVDLRQAKEGHIIVEFTERHVVVQLEHVHHRFPWTHSNTYFSFGGKKYHWKAHAALIEDDTKVCVAIFHTVNLGGPRRKHGSIVLASDGVELRDLAAVTRLADMARSQEAKLEVRLSTYTHANVLDKGVPKS